MNADRWFRLSSRFSRMVAPWSPVSVSRLGMCWPPGPEPWAARARPGLTFRTRIRCHHSSASVSRPALPRKPSGRRDNIGVTTSRQSKNFKTNHSVCLEQTSTTSSDFLNPKRIKLCFSLRLPCVHVTSPPPNRCCDPHPKSLRQGSVVAPAVPSTKTQRVTLRAPAAPRTPGVAPLWLADDLVKKCPIDADAVSKFE